MKKERKKPREQIRTTYSFDTNKFGFLTKKERDKIIRPLGKFEYEGKGLPEMIPKEGEHRDFNISFDVRIVHDKEGNLELSFACKNSTRHTIVPFEGLTGKQSCGASGDFTRNLIRMFKETFFILGDACVKNQLETFEKKREFHSEIVDYISHLYKELLGLGHYKIIEVTEADGIKKEKTVFIDYGARPQTKEEKEKEMREFLDEVYSAFKKFKQNHVREPKQKDLMPYMFEIYADKQKKISEMFGKHNLTFKMLWLIFNATDNYDDFINNAIRTKRVTSK